MTSYARDNRLADLAITNKHACVQGMPKINSTEAEEITKAILEMRGFKGNKQTDDFQKGKVKAKGEALHLPPHRA